MKENFTWDRELKKNLNNRKLDYESIFESCAKDLMNNHVLTHLDKQYFLMELEFYYYHKDNHPDPYVLMSDNQKSTNTFYFHRSGVDITFGDNYSYGGILLRGINLKNSNEYISGPINLIKEVFNTQKYNKSDFDSNSELSIEKTSILNSHNDIFKSTRVGLQVHPLDYELFSKSTNNVMPYIFKMYRFIRGPLGKLHGCKDKNKIKFYASLDSHKNRPKYKQDSI